MKLKSFFLPKSMNSCRLNAIVGESINVQLTDCTQEVLSPELFSDHS